MPQPSNRTQETAMPSGYVSSVIEASAPLVWNLVRDFNGLPQWYPGCVRSEIEDGLESDQIGCVRSFSMDDGVHVRERLIELRDEAPMWFAYRILDSPHRVDNYVARFRCMPVTDGDRSFVDWSVTFDCRDASESDYYVDFFQTEVYMVGFEAIRKHLEA